MLFGSIFSLLNHVYAMDTVWCSNLQSVAHNIKTRNPANLPTMKDLREKQIEINRWFESYTRKLSSKELNELVNFTFIGGSTGQIRVYEVIHHVVNHSTYHRGHIEGVFYQLSIEPPTTDIPVFLQTTRT